MNSNIYPLIGGVILGLSSSLMLWLLGQITGISGIYYNALNFKNGSWRFFFIIGLILGGGLIKTIWPELFNFNIFSNYYEIVIAGLLVGFGTKLGNGCTSGHGVCGLGRLSVRSLIATLVFMSAGIMTVFIRGSL